MAARTVEELINDLDCITEEGSFTTLPDIDEVVAITPKAALLRLDGYEEKWIPKSVLQVDTEGTIYVKEWYFTKEL